MATVNNKAQPIKECHVIFRTFQFPFLLIDRRILIFYLFKSRTIVPRNFSLCSLPIHDNNFPSKPLISYLNSFGHALWEGKKEWEVTKYGHKFHRIHVSLAYWASTPYSAWALPSIVEPFPFICFSFSSLSVFQNKTKQTTLPLIQQTPTSNLEFSHNSNTLSPFYSLDFRDLTNRFIVSPKSDFVANFCVART